MRLRPGATALPLPCTPLGRSVLAAALAQEQLAVERRLADTEISREGELECDHGHRWPEGQGAREGPGEWTGGVVLELCPVCGMPGVP